MTQPEEFVITSAAANSEEKLDSTSSTMCSTEEKEFVSETASPDTVTLEEQEGDALCDDSVLPQLAKQLEYYFSKANLSKDAYLQTLRELNDSYVPVSILANFQMVKRLVPYDAMGAIVRATKEFSSLLEIVFIDTKTGTKVADESSSTIWAVGSISREPLDYTAPSPSPRPVPIETPVATPTAKSPIQNTIILREVDDRVTEEEVRALFENDSDFPPVQSVYLDVANCWFVVLDTSSRDDMLKVMMQLRSKTLGGHVVKARVKSSARQVDTTLAPTIPVLLTPSTSMTSLTHYQSMGTPNRKKKKKTRSKNKNGSKKNFARSNMNGDSSYYNNKNSDKSRSGAGNTTRNISNIDREPILTGAEFPALGQEKVELVGVEDGMENLPSTTKSLSDAASTATTSTSSSLETKKQQQVGCYAAALLKSTPSSASLVDSENIPEKVKAKTVKRPSPSQQVEQRSSGDEKPQVDVATSQSEGRGTESPVVITPPSWGGGKSFADVLKEEEAAAASAAAGLAC